MRGTVDGLDSALPLALLLPGVYQEDAFAQRLMSGFDVVLAPVLATLDDLAAYVDPRLAPDDFVRWLAGWVGVPFDASWTPERRREVVAHAVPMHRRRGTLAGVVDLVRLAVGDDADIKVKDTGGASWSQAPDAPLPGGPEAALHVVVTVGDPDTVQMRRLHDLVAATAPAHVLCTVDVVRR